MERGERMKSTVEGEECQTLTGYLGINHANRNPSHCERGNEWAILATPYLLWM